MASAYRKTQPTAAPRRAFPEIDAILSVLGGPPSGPGPSPLFLHEIQALHAAADMFGDEAKDAQDAVRGAAAALAAAASQKASNATLMDAVDRAAAAMDSLCALHQPSPAPATAAAAAAKAARIALAGASAALIANRVR